MDLTPEAVESELFIRMPAQLSQEQFLPFLYQVGEWNAKDHNRKSIKIAANEVQVDEPELHGDQSARFEQKPERGYYQLYKAIEADTILAALALLREQGYNPNAVKGVDWACMELIYVKGTGDLIQVFEQTLLGWLEHPSVQAHLSDDFGKMVTRALLGPSLWDMLQSRLQSAQSTLGHKLVQILALGVYQRANKWYSRSALDKRQKRMLIDRALEALHIENRLKLQGWPNILRCLDDVERRVYTWLFLDIDTSFEDVASTYRVDPEWQMEGASAITLIPEMRAVAAFMHTLAPDLELIDLDRSLHRLEKRDSLAAYWIYQYFFLGQSYDDIAVANHVAAINVRYKIKMGMEKIRDWMEL